MKIEKMIKSVKAINTWSSNLLNSLEGLQDLSDEDEIQALGSISQIILKKAKTIHQALTGKTAPETTQKTSLKEDSIKIIQLEDLVKGQTEEIAQLSQHLVTVNEHNLQYERSLSELNMDNEVLKDKICHLETHLAVEHERSALTHEEVKRMKTKAEESGLVKRELESHVKSLEREIALLRVKLQDDNRKIEA